MWRRLDSEFLNPAASILGSRTEELDRALVGAIREPLLFLDFDSGTEQATLCILRSISRFEGVEDLEASTIYNVLTNDALRARLDASPTLVQDEETELVELAVVAEARRLEVELARLQSEKADLAATSRGALEDKAREAAALREVLAKRDEDVSTLSAEVDALRKMLDEEHRRSESKVERLVPDTRHSTADLNRSRPTAPDVEIAEALLSRSASLDVSLWRSRPFLRES